MTVIISHPDCLLHNDKIPHPECPNRLTVITNALASSVFADKLSYEEAPLATDEQLYRVHNKKYIESLLSRTPKEGVVYLDAETIITPWTFIAARRAAGAVVKAVDLLMSNQATSAFCNIRPPGHHAERDRAMGFCFFNNLAVGVAHALDFHQLKRVAIIDFDAHRGNGTEDIFFNNKQVLICSFYEENLYPFDMPRQAKNIINIPLRFAATGRELRAEFIQQGLERLEAFKPQMIFFSAGFDGHIQDTISNLNLIESDYFWLTQQIKQIAMTHSQGKMVSVLEGGYALASLGQCVVAHVKGLVDG